MQKQIEFQYNFLGIGERHTVCFMVAGIYKRLEMPAYDLEGELSNMPDVFEEFAITEIQDWTLGFNSGNVQIKNLPVDIRRDIVKQALKIADEQRKENKAALRNAC